MTATDLGLDDRFNEFHAVHPEVYVELVALARQWKRRGYRRVGIGMLWEVLRWQRALADVGDDHFRLNNDLRSRYARLIMGREADLAGIFATRELRT